MQIVPFIHVLRHPFKIPIGDGLELDRFVYSYLVYGETITLIDTGVAGCEARIFDYIRSTGRDPSEIALIILTHSHPDHIGAAQAIQLVTKCSIAAHPAERAWIENVELQNRERPVPGFTTLVGGSVQVDHELFDGEMINTSIVHTTDMKAIHTPGHSPGSVSLFMQSNGVLFSGDAIPVRGDIPVYDDALASIQSIEKLQRCAGIRVLLSAWDEPKFGEDAYRQMDRAVAYLQLIHDAVRNSADTSSPDLMEVTRKTAASIGLPPQAINPLLARTFAANLRVRELKSLLNEEVYR